MNNPEDEHRLNQTLPNCQPVVRAAIADYVRRLTTEYANEVISIILYGSQARGDAEDESDIDLFIVVQHNTPQLDEALARLAWEVQYKHGVVISDIVRSVDQYKVMRNNRFPYYQSIEREGVVLWTSASVPMLASA
jgi:predicted nucleotidyltransferase